MGDYKYKGEPLNEKIARYILLKNYAGKEPVSLNVLRKEVNNYHLSQGGKETEYTHQEPVQLALTRMKNKERLANNPDTAMWEVYSKESKQPNDKTSKDGDLKERNTMEDYENKGKSLTGTVAVPLIFEFFDKQVDVPRRVIEEKVTEVHLSRGGRPQTSETAYPFVAALDKLKDKNQADNPKRGLWTINSAGIEGNIIDAPVSVDQQEGVLTVGEGESSVYLYYFPTYRFYAESQDEDFYPCKIGRTDASDPAIYINNQASTSLPEQPEIGLIIKTDDPVGMEARMHRILDNARLRKEDAPGSEWFVTNPEQVKNFYELLG